MPETQLEGVDLLSKVSSRICELLRGAGLLNKWLALLSESMDMESETKLLMQSLSNLENTEESIKEVVSTMSKKLEMKLNEKRERSEGRGEREKGVSESEI